MNNLKIYLDKDINKNLIKNKKIAIIGFGSQGYGQGMNLVDSGCDVVFGLRENGQSWTKAKDYGLRTMSISDAVKWADIIQILIPDEIQSIVYEEEIKPYLHSGQYLMFSHGFNIHYGYITPPDGINIIMVAPKAPGHTVRSEYLAGKGVPALIAVFTPSEPSPARGEAKELALSYVQQSAQGEQALLKQLSKKKLKPIYLENKPFFAVVALHLSKQHSKL